MLHDIPTIPADPDFINWIHNCCRIVHILTILVWRNSVSFVMATKDWMKTVTVKSECFVLYKICTNAISEDLCILENAHIYHFVYWDWLKRYDCQIFHHKRKHHEKNTSVKIRLPLINTMKKYHLEKKIRKKVRHKKTLCKKTPTKKDNHEKKTTVKMSAFTMLWLQEPGL